MYSFNIIENGIAYTVYFFAAFSGHFQPFTPVEPLEFNEIHRGLIKYDSTPYVQGWYKETDAGPQLSKLIKYRLMGVPFNGKFQLQTTPGVYYRRLEKIDGHWQANENITPEEVLKQSHYLRYVVNKDGNVENSLHVYSMIWDSYTYTYNSNGTLKKTDTTVNPTPTEIPDL